MSFEKSNSAVPGTNHAVSIGTILKVVAVFVGLYLLFVIRDIILLLVISVILASALNPLVEWLYSKIKFPRGLTVVLVYVVFIALVVLILSLLIPNLIVEFGNLGAAVQQLEKKIDVQGSSVLELLQRYGFSNFLQNLSSSLEGLASNIFETTLGFFSGIFDIISVLVISFYLVSQRNGIMDFVKFLSPVASHARVESVVSSAQKKLGKWLLGQLALMASIFILTYIGLSILHVKYALTLALLAGLLEVVPYLGPIISAVPAALVALLSSYGLAIAVIVLYVVVQQSENYLLVPKILGKSIGANPLVVLIALLIGYSIAGIIGVIISAPLVAVGVVILEEFGWYEKTPAGAKSKTG